MIPRGTCQTCRMSHLIPNSEPRHRGARQGRGLLAPSASRVDIVAWLASAGQATASRHPGRCCVAAHGAFGHRRCQSATSRCHTCACMCKCCEWSPARLSPDGAKQSPTWTEIASSPTTLLATLAHTTDASAHRGPTAPGVTLAEQWRRLQRNSALVAESPKISPRRPSLSLLLMIILRDDSPKNRSCRPSRSIMLPVSCS